MVFTVINQRDVYNVLDIGKVADIIVFVMSCADAQVDKLRDDPNTYANAIDETGYEMLRILRAQGMPAPVGVLQHLE